METEKNTARYEGSSSKSACSVIIMLLRLLAIGTTLVSALVLGLAKQTKTVHITVAPTLPPLPVPVTAKSTYSSAFVYSVVVNAITCFYSALSLVMSILKKSKKSNLSLVVVAADLVMVALLFSGSGAAAAIGVVGERGISNVRWNKVCNVFTKFCADILVAIVASLVASLAYVLIVLLSIVGLHKKSSPQ